MSYRWKPACEARGGLAAPTYLVTYEHDAVRRTAHAYREADTWDGQNWRDCDTEEPVPGTVVSFLEIGPDTSTEIRESLAEREMKGKL